MNEFITTTNEHKREIKVLSDTLVRIGDREQEVEFSKVSNYLYLLKIGNKTYEITTHKQNEEKFRFGVDGHSFEVTVRTKLKETANEVIKNKITETHITKITSPMPGLLLKIHKAIGEHVEENEPIVVLEAMKMENEIRSPKSGIIKEIFMKHGSTLEKDAVILTIE
ncbi:MAG: hypothetical protein C0412_02505 [Flavobacterium sp.]|nr:hypothetical protein [Flavobacterium sp.]